MSEKPLKFPDNALPSADHQEANITPYPEPWEITERSSMVQQYHDAQEKYFPARYSGDPDTKPSPPTRP